MSGLTCDEAAERLELYAAGECDAAERSAVEAHLAGCPACAASAEEARRLVALLDVRLQEPERLARLHARLNAAARPKRQARRVLPLLQRLGSLAAALLLALGLGVFLRAGLTGEDDRMALRVSLDGGRGAKFVGPDGAPELVRPMIDLAKGGADAAVVRLERDQSAADLRRALDRDAGTKRLPPPPAVNLTLTLRNRGTRAVELDASDPRTQLLIDLRGPETEAVEAPPGAARTALQPSRVVLRPGGTAELHLERLTSLEQGRARYLYWTAPGDYTLSVRLRAALTPLDGAGGARLATAEAGPVTLHVLPR